LIIWVVHTTPVEIKDMNSSFGSGLRVFKTNTKQLTNLYKGGKEIMECSTGRSATSVQHDMPTGR